MRLIDADNLKYESLWVYPNRTDDYKECVGVTADIENAPTVEAVPIELLSKAISDIKKRADKQFHMAAGCSDFDEKYVHIRMHEAYAQCISILEDLCKEFSDYELS